MLLRLQNPLTDADLDSVVRLATELGYRPRLLDGRRDLLELDGPGAPEHRSRLEELTAVAAVLDAGDARELFHKTSDRKATHVVVGAAQFGAGAASIIAGPCAVEDETRLVQIAREVKAAGATLLRAGAFKPRTSPYSFQGLGLEGLPILARVRAETGLGIVTEALDPRDVDAIAQVADVIQIGTRNMSNAALLREVGRLRKPVLLKRGFGATVKEWLYAAEYVLAEGNDQVVLCERGIRGFDTFTRNVLDVGAIAYLKTLTHLPVIADPSHAAGRSDLVPALARAGIVAGADGLLVEVHSAPWEVHSDGNQAVSLPDFKALAEATEQLLALDGRRLCVARSSETPATV